jgi:hypothetical protein
MMEEEVVVVPVMVVAVIFQSVTQMMVENEQAVEQVERKISDNKIFIKNNRCQ